MKKSEPKQTFDLEGKFVCDRYHVLRFLGAGSNGEVFAAEDVPNDRIVALKILRKKTADPMSPERFLREAQTLGRVVHRNVVRIYDFDRDLQHGVLFVAMEFAIGDDLSRIIKHGRLPVTLTLAALEEIAEGLNATHSAGIVHRDLKPSNLKLRVRRDHTLRVKVLDFGLVQDRESEIKLTDQGKAPGTVSYMQPEILAEEPFDARADLYSLGVIAYEMLAGHTPFPGRNPTQVALGHLQRSPPPLSKLLPEELDPGVEALVMSMLEKKPDKRIGSALEVRDRARELREASGIELSFTFTGAAENLVRDWGLLPHL